MGRVEEDPVDGVVRVQLGHRVEAPRVDVARDDAAKGAGGIAANDAWHAAYEGLLLQVLATYRNTPHAPAAEAAFALPYTEACDRLRASERKARRAKKDDPNPI